MADLLHDFCDLFIGTNEQEPVYLILFSSGLVVFAAGRVNSSFLSPET